MDEKGITINSGKYDGEFYLKNEPKVVEDLEEAGALVHVSKFTHSHPID
jgi:isoleucyl-tRNA synthetase